MKKQPSPPPDDVPDLDMQDRLKAAIREAATAYVQREGSACPVERLPIDLRLSAQEAFGDYSMPVMPWASKDRLARPPMAIAEAVAALVRDAGDPTIQEVTVTPPGYLNVRLYRPAAGRTVVERVLAAASAFGKSSIGAGSKVVVEHTNINSNKAAHVGHLRNSCLGDTVVRMLRGQGYEVEAQNYIDDTGVQVADVVVGFTLLGNGGLSLPEGNDQLPGESYDYYCSRVYVAVGKAYDRARAAQDEEYRRQGKEDVDPKGRPPTELEQLRRAVLRGIEHGGAQGEGPNYAAMAADLSRRIVQAHLATMARLNVSYDLLTWESAILDAGLWRRTFEMLKERDILRHPESGRLAGCWVLPFGDGEAQDEDGEHTADKILVKSDGTATYTGKDIAYQLWKFGLADDPKMGLKFRFGEWGAQFDGRMLWTMHSPRYGRASGPRTDPKRFGHARRVINVIDVRQSYPQQVVYESLRRLGYPEQADASTHLAYEVVTLSAATAARLGVDTSDNHPFYAMSGRKGIEIKADDLIDTAVARMRESRPELPGETAAVLAASAIRYFMIRVDLQQIIALDVDEALRATGDTGVYLQYAHVRAHSILRRLREAGYDPPAEGVAVPDTLEQSEWELLRHIDAYPRTLAAATAQLAPHLLAAYAHDLAVHFTDLYEHTPPILKEGDERTKAFRARLVRATAQTLGNALQVLGFQPLERL